MDRTRQNGTVRMALLVLLLYFIIPAPFCQVFFEKNFLRFDPEDPKKNLQFRFTFVYYLWYNNF